MQNMRNDAARSPGEGQRFRHRGKGYFSGKKGKAVGITAVLTPIVGYVVNDLRRPDSFLRTLLKSTVQKLISSKAKETKAIDITDKVEVVRGKDEIESES